MPKYVFWPKSRSCLQVWFGHLFSVILTVLIQNPNRLTTDFEYKIWTVFRLWLYLDPVSDKQISKLVNFAGGDLVEARFSRTQLGNALLVDPDGFCYCINRKREKRIYWVCHQQRRYKCRGSAITEGFFIIKRGGGQGHTHSPYPLPQNKYTKDLWVNKATW